MKLAGFLLVIAPTFVVADTMCPFLASDSAPPITFDLPAIALTNPVVDLPLKFQGIHPIVTRRDVPYGSKPKVIALRYSSAPEIVYDEATKSVVISSASCATTSTTSNAYRNSVGFFSTKTRKWMAMTAATCIVGIMDEHLRPAAAALVLSAAFGGVEAFNSQSVRVLQETCMPTVEVVVEAPAAYQGAVATCLAEIKDPIVCPDPFPTYKTCSDPAPKCGVAVVGAGAGGLYTALRMVDEKKVSGSDICVFEMTDRVGGRLMSLRGLGPESDLTVDAGGYRTRPEFTPTLHALITEYLEIPMECYDDSSPCTVFTIVNESGKKAGFATFVEEMMTRLVDAGACFYPYHELKTLTKIQVDEGEAMESRAANADGGEMMELRFANGVVATANITTILNMPQKPLMAVVRNSKFDDAGLIDAPTLDALHSVQTVIATKLYLYYPRGHVFWWKLGLKSGDYEFAGDARNMLLGGRYHDGQVECDDEADLSTCHGFLLAVYVNDLSGNKAQFFRRYQRERPEPVTIISNTDLEGAEFLKHAHSRLEEFHLYNNPNASYTGAQALAVFGETSPPTFAVLSTWNSDVPWAGGAWHLWTDLDNVDTAMQPFVDHNIYVINEAYSLLHGWAEGSLKLGDEILESYFGIPRPWNFTVTDIVQTVAQTDSRECVGVGSNSTSGGGTGSSGSSAGSGSGGGSVLCFTGNAKVQMADGTYKEIRDVRIGDSVATGMNDGHANGLVTETLIHPVESITLVSVVRTELGELVGTPTHPIFHNGEWIEMGEVADLEKISLENRYVHNFFNLEIDGHLLHESSHSYVVNGIVASGLGDNEELNRLFKRQHVWKEVQYNNNNADAGDAIVTEA